MREFLNAPIYLPPLIHINDYQTSEKQDVLDVSGKKIAEVGIVPALLVSKIMKNLREAQSLSLHSRIEALARAGKIFATETIDGFSLNDYEWAVSRVTGLPISVVRTATETLRCRTMRIFDTIDHARPNNAVFDWKSPLTRSGRGLWARRSNVLAVHAVGNHPATQTLWPEALALGYRVAVRPFRKEPFTPHRLVSALHKAGFGPEHVAFLPTENDGAEAIFQGADLAYGGDEIIRKHANEPKVLALTPGRSKILLTKNVNWYDHIDTIINSICHHGGTGCVNTTAVFVEGDVIAVAEAIKDRLSNLPNFPPEDERAVLPVQSLDTATSYVQYIKTKSLGTRALLGSDDILFPLSDGSVVMRPAVHQVEDPFASQTGIELPFPCVWISPWSNEVGIAPLKNTLVLTALTNNEQLIDALVNEPSIRNVFLGNYPTYWTDIGLPHDGYLAEFLMRTKTVVRDDFFI